MVWQANHLFPLGVSFVRTCRGCGEDKELESFGFRNKAAARRHQKCRACVAEYGRAHYERNRQEYITRSLGNMRVRRRALKEKVWCYLAENPCVDCGEAGAGRRCSSHGRNWRSLKATGLAGVHRRRSSADSGYA